HPDHAAALTRERLHELPPVLADRRHHFVRDRPAVDEAPVTVVLEQDAPLVVEHVRRVAWPDEQPCIFAAERGLPFLRAQRWRARRERLGRAVARERDCVVIQARGWRDDAAVRAYAVRLRP